ncbi:hypothetical protein FD755_002381 [Muntiacus reevesi]|uniref:Uncharacterized protein n=1 Tax=Muntiacus reevesi TaxID=9886 RepID=A0A5J5N430_MUNRE|nr:hypothetical protein FD755_002381 [Muntiacus reevesi]
MYLLSRKVTFTTRTTSGGYANVRVKAGGSVLGQMIRAYGLRILGQLLLKEGQKSALQNGAHELFTDVIIEMFANINLSKDLNFLSHGGQVIEEFPQFAAALQARMKIGWLRPVIGPQYSLGKVAQAHEDITHTSGAMGKIILLLKSLILPLVFCVIKRFLTLVLCRLHLLCLAII